MAVAAEREELQQVEQVHRGKHVAVGRHRKHRPGEFAGPTVGQQFLVLNRRLSGLCQDSRAAHDFWCFARGPRNPDNLRFSNRGLPSTLGVTAGDLVVQLIDKGDNRAGIGIRVKVPEGRTLTDEEMQIVRRHVKGEDGEQTGFSWDRDNQMWHKQIVRAGENPDDVPRSRPVAIRLDAENRVEKLAESLKQHQADPVGFAEAVRQRREQAAESGRIPD